MTSYVTGALIEVTVQLNAANEPVFGYTQNGEPTDGNVVVAVGQNIVYQLKSAGYSFVGAGFLTPNDGIIDEMEVSADGNQLTLVDTDATPGTTKFQLVLKNAQNSLFVISPDPQVVNKGEE
ncbi:DP-EP family protein [Rheinheimera sp.]|uniref:DP-EP family protein n=1 Tax=Rheinheimera sp. TaxID=1869214 RepID=UPI00307D5D2F